MKKLFKNKAVSAKTISFSAMFLVLAFVMPFLTGQIPQIGSMLCPMHIPVLLCGFLCGGSWGLIVGLIAPVLRSVLIGMPVLFPMAVCMSLELGTYGFVAGILYEKLVKGKWSIYISLISAMILGRIVWGIAMFVCMGFDSTKFGFDAFLSGAITMAIPGIIVQIVLVPIIVTIWRKWEK